MNKTLLSITFIGALGFTAAAQAVTIDDFTVTQEAQDSLSDGNPVNGTPADVNPTGSFTSRVADANRTDTNPSAGFTAIKINTSTNPGFLLTNATANATGTLSVTWRGPSTTVDLTAGGDDAFELTYDSSGGVATVQVILSTNVSDASTWQGSGLANAVAGDILRIPYADFVQFGTGPADLTDITEITVAFGMEADSFLELQSIQTGQVPAAAPIPSSLALLGLGLIGMRRFRRRA